MIALTAARRHRGFTAVEISMVVTIIAILALLILPLFQRQTDEARLAAAEGDIREFAISMQLANAHTERYFTLQSLDNTENFDETNIDPTIDVPVNTWNDTLDENERSAIADRWHGPYASFRRVVTPDELGNTLGETFWFRGGINGSTTNSGAADGPINHQVDATVLSNFTGGEDFGDDRMPLDPWNRPYIFYGPDYYHPPNGLSGLETRFRNSLFLSLGPNGLPGDGTSGIGASQLRRENGIIATGDDIFRIM